MTAPRTALRPDHEIAVIGSGFAGLCAAIKLRQAGRSDFVLFEKEADVGGTWLVNTYPGCACDVQSHLYSFSFAPNPDWSRMFSPQREIRDYLRRCAERYGVRPHVRFNTEIAGARYDEPSGLWVLTSADGREFTARVLISGMGGLSRPMIPELPGLDRFQGRMFHSQQWDHGYDLAGKRVAVIGTGASAIQFVPQIQPQVAGLKLFQRTPPWIMPKPDRPIGRFERWLFRRLPFTQRLFRHAIYWMLEARVPGFTRQTWVMRMAQKMALHHMHRQVRDPALRARLTPDYVMGCKRVLMANDYYPALAQSNVEVIPHGVREITADGLVAADGSRHRLDAIIFGTGFHATDPLPRGAIVGRDGVDILDAWKDGPEAYLGTTVAGFPNLFILTGPNTGLGHTSMVFMIESQVRYIVGAVQALRRRRLRSLEVRADLQQAYNRKLQARLARTVWNSGGCSSWYLNASGRNVTLWPGFTWTFRLRTRSFRLRDYVAVAGVAPEANDAAAPVATQTAC